MYQNKICKQIDLSDPPITWMLPSGNFDGAKTRMGTPSCQRTGTLFAFQNLWEVWDLGECMIPTELLSPKILGTLSLPKSR